jgi:hypothetical protein
MNLENPFSQGAFDCGGFTIESELNLIAEVVPNEKGGWTLSYNNGLGLRAKSLSGEIQYEGDFGRIKLDWARVTKMTTVKNQNKQREVGNFSREHYNNKIKIAFQDGATITAYAAKGDLQLPAKFRGNNAKVFPSKAHLVFDWAASRVKASSGTNTPVTMELIPPPTGRLRGNGDLERKKREQSCWTDIGEISFNWNGVAEMQPMDDGSKPFAGEYTCVVGDGTSIAIASIEDTYSDFEWTYQKAHPRKINGHEVRKIFWENVSQIRMGEQAGVATCVFSDGKECLVSADMLRAEWNFGTIDIPFSSRGFSRITRNQPATATASRKAFSHHVRFQSGDTWDATLLEVGAFSASTAPGVLHLVEIPVAHGLLLTEKANLALTIAEKKMQVRGLSKTYPVLAADLDKKAGLATLYGEFEFDFNSIAVLEPINPPATNAGTKSVAVTFRDGTKMIIACSNMEFVRYPDRIYNGTYYNVELGAWFWRRYDKITVVTPDATTDVEFDRIKMLSISGSSPTWGVELEGAKSGARLKGNLKPEEAAKQSPGVASWNTEKDGFWFSHPRKAEFLFLRIKDVAELDIRPAN